MTRWAWLAGIVLAHELGHWAAARIVGARVLGWGVRRGCPWVRVLVHPPCRWRTAVCLLAGPLVDVVGLVVACWIKWPVAAAISLVMVLSNLILPKSDGRKAWSV